MASATLVVATLLGACVKPGGVESTASAEPATVRLGDRTLDIAPFLTGYPYSPVIPAWDDGLLFVDHQGPTRSFRSVQTDFGATPPDLGQATALNEVDWDGRNRWGVRVHGPTGMLYWQGDAVNDEKIDLWRMPLAGGEPERLTDEPYLYGFSFSPDDASIALLPRRGEGPFRSCLEHMHVETGERKPVICDTPEVPLTWSRPSWAPDGRGVLTRVNLEGQRSKGNLAWVDFAAPNLRLMLDPAPQRRAAFALDTWLDANTAVVFVDDDAEEQILALDVRTGETRLLWTPREPMQFVHLLEPQAGQKRLVVAEHTPVQDTIYLVDPSSGEELASTVLPGSASWLGDDETSRALLRVNTASTPLDTRILDVGASSLALRPFVTLPDALQESLVACEVERVQFPTWDTDPQTGERRQLHAFLYTPKGATDRATMPVRITAFYGGGNRYRADTQIHCAAGIATLSPSVRGTHDFGPAFAALNDGDLGGDEIVDLYEGARWLETQGFSQGRIGVHGGSHGGYATMRALTFPEGTNDHPAERLYPLSFGTSRAGFSDIITFHDTCNIPDWVLLEAGDPKTEADKLRDRSPLHHVELLRAPLLLVHGENDSRVPVAESRQMAQACEAAGKDCVYEEFAGMGHHIKGVTNQTRMYQALFDLIYRASSDSEPR